MRHGIPWKPKSSCKAVSSSISSLYVGVLFSRRLYPPPPHCSLPSPPLWDCPFLCLKSPLCLLLGALLNHCISAQCPVLYVPSLGTCSPWLHETSFSSWCELAPVLWSAFPTGLPPSLAQPLPACSFWPQPMSPTSVCLPAPVLSESDPTHRLSWKLPTLQTG